MYHIRRGAGPKLLLIHGLGGSWQSWTPILDGLSASQTVIAIDLVGSSMGARIVLELARRGGVGNVIALDPGGF